MTGKGGARCGDAVRPINERRSVNEATEQGTSNGERRALKLDGRGAMEKTQTGSGSQKLSMTSGAQVSAARSIYSNID